MVFSLVNEVFKRAKTRVGSSRWKLWVIVLRSGQGWPSSTNCPGGAGGRGWSCCSLPGAGGRPVLSVGLSRCRRASPPPRTVSAAGNAAGLSGLMCHCDNREGS